MRKAEHFFGICLTLVDQKRLMKKQVALFEGLEKEEGLVSCGFLA